MNKTDLYLISAIELKKLIEQQIELQLIDVRTLEKHQQFNIGGISIPSADLHLHKDKLDPNRLTITYCTTGNNSMRALAYLVSVGFNNVKSLDGGITKWKEEGLITT